MGVIAYDKPVRDFIAGLNATGHVTHTKHRKLSVTFHHNAGRLSLQGILDVWKTRPASAQFQVDGQGAVGQYVLLNEYAWHTGTTQGNVESVGIEMANSTLSPVWQVAEVTWREACRLAGWIHARAFGFRPTRNSVKLHKDWKATICAGPYIDSVFSVMLAETQRWYDHFVGGATPSPTPQPPTKSLNTIVDEVIAGQWGNGEDRKRRLTLAGYNATEVQTAVNAKLSGGSSPQTPSRKSVSQLADEVIAGHWGNGPDRMNRLNGAGYNAGEVQAEVNRKLGVKSGSAQPTRPSLAALAQQVINGQWGNGIDRRRRLSQAGYNYEMVQAEVNRRLR